MAHGKIQSPTSDTAKSLRIRLRTAMVLTWFSFYLFILTVVLGPLLWFAGKTFDPQRRLARRLTRVFYRQGMRGFFGPRLVIHSLPSGVIPEPCIIVANHQSAIDILLLFQLSPDAICWAKEWPFHRPLLGWLMRLCGHLRVDQADILDQAANSLAKGVSLYVFPEGTRSRTGRVGRFQDGAFLLSVRTGVPIIPIAIRGSGNCMKPDHITIIDTEIHLEPLGILHPDSHVPKPHLLLKSQARDMIMQSLGQSQLRENVSPEVSPAMAVIDPRIYPESKI